VVWISFQFIIGVASQASGGHSTGRARDPQRGVAGLADRVWIAQAGKRSPRNTVRARYASLVRTAWGLRNDPQRGQLVVALREHRQRPGKRLLRRAEFNVPREVAGDELSEHPFRPRQVAAVSPQVWWLWHGFRDLGQAVRRRRRRRNSKDARPYIWRFRSLSLLTWPSVWPLLQMKERAASTGA
jgi:hypothetical protein